MRVLLIQSYLGGNEPVVFPIGLASLAASLVGHEVSGFDTNVSRDVFGGLRSKVLSFRPDVIGISLRNIDSTNKRKVVFYYPLLNDTIKLLRSVTDVKIIIGGSGFSMFAREIMEQESGIDLGVYLEGEETFAKLLDSLDSPERVASVFFRRNGKVMFSGFGGTQADLNRLPLPNRKAFWVPAYRNGFPDAMGVETKRGCPLGCVYCIYGFLNGKKMRLRDPVRIVDDIAAVVKEQGVKRFTFVDSVFNLPQQHAAEICNELIARGINVKWSAWFNERYANLEFLRLASRAGCVHAIFSPDGFSDETLIKLGKDIRKADVLRVYRLLPKLEGIEFSYNFFKNPPGQTVVGFISMLVFAVVAKSRFGRRIHFEFSTLRIEPNTKLFEIAVEEGVIGPDESLLYPRYYSNRRTRFLERGFDALLRLREMISMMRASR